MSSLLDIRDYSIADHLRMIASMARQTQNHLFPRFVARDYTRVVSVWFGLPNMNGIQPNSLERSSVQVERNMSKAVLVPRNT